MIDYLIRHGYGRNHGSIAKLSSLAGIPHTTVRSWFGGKSGRSRISRPSIEHAVAVATALGVSLDLLLTGKEYWTELENPTVSRLCRMLGQMPPEDIADVEALVEHKTAVIARAQRAAEG